MRDCCVIWIQEVWKSTKNFLALKNFYAVYVRTVKVSLGTLRVLEFWRYFQSRHCEKYLVLVAHEDYLLSEPTGHFKFKWILLFVPDWF